MNIYQAKFRAAHFRGELSFCLSFHKKKTPLRQTKGVIMHFLHGEYFISPHHHFNMLELTEEPEIILVSIIINNITLLIDRKSCLWPNVFSGIQYSTQCLYCQRNTTVLP